MVTSLEIGETQADSRSNDLCCPCGRLLIKTPNTIIVLQLLLGKQIQYLNTVHQKDRILDIKTSCAPSYN